MKRTVKTFPYFEFPGDDFVLDAVVAIAVHVPVAFETAVDVDNRATGDRVEVADSRSGKRKCQSTFSRISTISRGVMTNGFRGKCLVFPVTKYASSLLILTS